VFTITVTAITKLLVKFAYFLIKIYKIGWIEPSKSQTPINKIHSAENKSVFLRLFRKRQDGSAPTFLGLGKIRENTCSLQPALKSNAPDH